jgi:hypothetical protein
MVLGDPFHRAVKDLSSLRTPSTLRSPGFLSLSYLVGYPVAHRTVSGGVGNFYDPSNTALVA